MVVVGKHVLHFCSLLKSSATQLLKSERICAPLPCVHREERVAPTEFHGPGPDLRQREGVCAPGPRGDAELAVDGGTNLTHKSSGPVIPIDTLTWIPGQNRWDPILG